MAVTPKEALGNKLEQEVMQMQKLEALIDGILKDRFDGTAHTITIDVPQGYGYRTVTAVLKRYEAAGWEVKQTSPRGENMMEFKPREILRI